MRKSKILTILAVSSLCIAWSTAAWADDPESKKLDERVQQLEDELDSLKQALGRSASGGGTPGGSEGHGPKFGTFEFTGFLNAPMRIGFGRRENPSPGQRKTTIHSPLIPDDMYFTWQHTEHNPRNWAEMDFHYGNDVAKAHLAVQAFNFSEAAWTEQNAQLGIGRAYVSLRPRLKGTSIRLRAKVGAFSEAYGAANKYSTDNEAVASQHGAYLIGRIRTIGEVIKVEIPYKAFTLALDHGFGANRPDPSVWNPSRFSLVHHAHAVLRYRNVVEVGGHYVNSWAQEDLRPTDPANPDHWQDDEFSADYPDGKLSVYGADARLRLGRGGYYYGGYSYVLAQNVGVVGQAVEVIHATGGGQYNVGIKGNYLDGPEANSNGNGAIHTVMIEGEHSVRTLLEGDDYWGQKRDLAVKFYAMLNQVRSDDDFIDGQWKFKWGTDLVFNALPWLQVATRYDRLQPDHRIPEQSFSILSPRLVFRTNWITNEYITLQYSRYFYNARTCPNGNDPGTPGHGQYCVQPPSGPVQPDGFGITRDNTDAEWRGVSSNIPDQSVVTIQATMWW